MPQWTSAQAMADPRGGTKTVTDVSGSKAQVGSKIDFFSGAAKKALDRCISGDRRYADPHAKPLTELQPSGSPRKQALEDINKLWCLCRGPEDQDSTEACDNENCAMQWFHLGCEGLSQAPSASERWLCATCTRNWNSGAQVCIYIFLIYGWTQTLMFYSFFLICFLYFTKEDTVTMWTFQSNSFHVKFLSWCFYICLFKKKKNLSCTWNVSIWRLHCHFTSLTCCIRTTLVLWTLHIYFSVALINIILH